MEWLRARNFTWGEILWIAGFASTVMVLSTAPYLIFAAMTPPEREYAWASVFYHDDYYQYYAWARHIAAGEWRIRNYYTAEPASSFGLFNPYFLTLGWMTRATGSVYFASHLLRVAAIAGFAWISYAFVGLFLDEPKLRRAAQVLMLGGGFEYPWALSFGSRVPTPLADPYVFKVLYRYGHLTVAMSLLLLIFGEYVARMRQAEPAGRDEMIGAGLRLGAMTLVLALINPYYLVLAVGVIGLHAIAEAVRNKNFAGAVLAGSAGAGGLVAYGHYRFQPLLGRLGAIAFDDPVGLLDLGLFVFALIVPAVAGWLYLWRREIRRSDRWSRQGFLLVWFVAVVLLVLTPLPFKARMTFGLTLLLAIPAAAWLGRRGFVSPAALPIYALLLVEPAFTFYKEHLDFEMKQVGQLDRSMLAAFRYLDEHSKAGDVVLTSGDTGNFVPAYCMANVVSGHSFQTTNFEKTEQEVEAFFRDVNSAGARDWLEKSNAGFVLMGPIERGLAGGREFRGWPKVYGYSGWEIFKKKEPGEGTADSR